MLFENDVSLNLHLLKLHRTYLLRAVVVLDNSQFLNPDSENHVSEKSVPKKVDLLKDMFLILHPWTMLLVRYDLENNEPSKLHIFSSDFVFESTDLYWLMLLSGLVFVFSVSDWPLLLSGVVFSYFTNQSLFPYDGIMKHSYLESSGLSFSFDCNSSGLRSGQKQTYNLFLVLSS